jgi:hypothetical protein
MRYGCAPVTADGRSVEAQARRSKAAGAEKVYRETASDRAHPLLPAALTTLRFPPPVSALAL